jgi:hypothetical protein
MRLEAVTGFSRNILNAETRHVASQNFSERKISSRALAEKPDGQRFSKWLTIFES